MARALKILFVEDNRDDISLVQRATRTVDPKHQLITVRDGYEAVRQLQGAGAKGGDKESVFPNLILVDLKMPGMNGFELLQWLKEQPEYCSIPALVFSGSILESDVHQAYELGAKGYLSKPADFDDLVEQLRAVYSFWSFCEFPHYPGQGASGPRRDSQPGEHSP